MNSITTPGPRPEPMFTLDLKGNGGLFAPTVKGIPPSALEFLTRQSKG